MGHFTRQELREGGRIAARKREEKAFRRGAAVAFGLMGMFEAIHLNYAPPNTFTVSGLCAGCDDHCDALAMRDGDFLCPLCMEQQT